MKKIALALALTASLVGHAHAHGGYRGAPVWGAVAAGVIVGAAIAGAPVYAAPPVYVAPQPVYPQPVYQQPVPNYACPPGSIPYYTNVMYYDAYGRPYTRNQLTCQ
jgi:hypothetical protein